MFGFKKCKEPRAFYFLSVEEPDLTPLCCGDLAMQDFSSYPLLPSLYFFFVPILPSLHSELSGGCIIDKHLYLWHLLRLSFPLTPSFSPPPSLARCVPGLMQLGRYLGQHQSFIQTPHTHTHRKLCIHIQQLCQNVCAWGAQEQRVALGGRSIKITLSPPCLPSRVCDSRCRGDFDKCYTAVKP